MFDKSAKANLQFSPTRRFAAVNKAIILLFILFIGPPVFAKIVDPTQVGAFQHSHYLPLLKGKRVGLVVNQTSLVGQTHLVDFLLENKINVRRVFAPEHGFRGNLDAGAVVKSGVDSQTGLPVVSIYGKHKKPSSSALTDLDIILFDIQDVGVRFYTYLSSMHYMMQAAQEHNLAFMVLDRPNPNIRFVAGPLLKDEFRSFVGMHPIPVLHGMTLGELARMIKGEGWLQIEGSSNKKSNEPLADLALTVVPVQDYQRTDTYPLPVKPSPNLPNSQAISLYPSLCLFEGTAVSVGRGTGFPFQLLGHDKVHLGDFSFTPISTPGAALYPKLQDKLLRGLDLRQSAIQGFNLNLLEAYHQAFKQQKQAFFTSPKFFDKLAGTDQIRLSLEQGRSLAELEQSWQTDIDAFKTRRRPYLLYPE